MANRHVLVNIKAKRPESRRGIMILLVAYERDRSMAVTPVKRRGYAYSRVIKPVIQVEWNVTDDVLVSKPVRCKCIL